MSFPELDLAQWVTTLGYAGILLIIFVETGLFFGFFLPGDSLLFTAGFLASQKLFNIWLLVPSMIITALLGYQLGFVIGGRLGTWLTGRPDSFWFKQKYLVQAKVFYDKHGGKAIILGRLLPIVRTFIPVVAGMIKMRARHYFILNLLGALVWAGGVTLIGYFLGGAIPEANHYILPIVFGIIILSLLPGVVKYFR